MVGFLSVLPVRWRPDPVGETGTAILGLPIPHVVDSRVAMGIFSFSMTHNGLHVILTTMR
jgi:hypothetical protein